MRKKLKLFFLVVFIVFAAGSLTTAILIRNANKEIDRISGLHQMDSMRRGVLDSFSGIYRAVLDAERMREKDIDEIIDAISRMHGATANCLSCHRGDRVVEHTDLLNEKMHKFQETLSFFITTSANSRRMDRLGIEAVQQGSEVLQTVEQLHILANEQMRRSAYEMIQKLNYASYVFYATIAAISALCLVLGLTLSRSITGPIKNLIEGTRMIESGNLGFKIENLGDDEFGELGGHFNRMSEELGRTVETLESTNRQLKIEIEEHQRAERERQQLLDELVHARKMEAVGTLAGGIAHEFNNLLQSIQSSAEFMQLSVGDDERKKKHLNVILNASGRGAELTKRLLTFSRRVEGEMRPFNLITAIEQLQYILNDSIPETITFTITTGDQPLTILGDVTSIEQILLNLILNARDALKNGGEISLRASVCPETEWPEALKVPEGCLGVALLEVRDNGMGMDETTRQKIFEPFFTTKSMGFGAGLGLAITYGVVHSHGGHIECASAPGKGTIFSIWLPLVKPIGD